MRLLGSSLFHQLQCRNAHPCLLHMHAHRPLSVFSTSSHAFFTEGERPAKKILGPFEALDRYQVPLTKKKRQPTRACDTRRKCQTYVRHLYLCEPTGIMRNVTRPLAPYIREGRKIPAPSWELGFSFQGRWAF